MDIGWQIPRIPRQSSRRFDRLATIYTGLSVVRFNRVDLTPSEQFQEKQRALEKTVGRRWISTAKVVDKLSFDCGQVVLPLGDFSPYE